LKEHDIDFVQTLPLVLSDIMFPQKYKKLREYEMSIRFFPQNIKISSKYYYFVEK